MSLGQYLVNVANYRVPNRFRISYVTEAVTDAGICIMVRTAKGVPLTFMVPRYTTAESYYGLQFKQQVRACTRLY